jgi:hypothetical protein
MQPLKPNAQRAKMAIILIWIVFALNCIALISKFFQYNLLQTVVNGGSITIEEANANDTREQIIAVIYIIFYLVSGVTFIQWFRRAYYNLHERATILSYTEGWAAGSWFVPIIHFYRPYKIMKELYEETQELLAKRGINVEEKLNLVHIGWWWSLWVINSLMGQFLFRYTKSAEGVEELSNATVFGIVGNFIGIPLALITIKIISDYASIEPIFAQPHIEEKITSTPPSDDEGFEYVPVELN